MNANDRLWFSIVVSSLPFAGRISCGLVGTSGLEATPEPSDVSARAAAAAPVVTPTPEAFDEMRAISVLDGQKTDHSGDFGETAEDIDERCHRCNVVRKGEMRDEEA